MNASVGVSLATWDYPAPMAQLYVEPWDGSRPFSIYLRAKISKRSGHGLDSATLQECAVDPDKAIELFEAWRQGRKIRGLAWRAGLHVQPAIRLWLGKRYNRAFYGDWLDPLPVAHFMSKAHRSIRQGLPRTISQRGLEAWARDDLSVACRMWGCLTAPVQAHSAKVVYDKLLSLL